GTNKRGAARWTTECVVTDSEPGRRFAFNVYSIGLKKPWLRYKIARWDFTLEPDGSATRVTETWTDGRESWPDWSARIFDKFATGTTFHQFQQRNIARTLKRLKADFEA
ncbi:MAG: SRPBCC family protein, partial [Marmoricola sp.]